MTSIVPSRPPNSVTHPASVDNKQPFSKGLSNIGEVSLSERRDQKRPERIEHCIADRIVEAVLRQWHRDTRLGGNDIKRKLEQFPDHSEGEHDDEDVHEKDASWYVNHIVVDVDGPGCRVSERGDE